MKGVGWKRLGVEGEGEVVSDDGFEAIEDEDEDDGAACDGGEDHSQMSVVIDGGE